MHRIGGIALTVTDFLTYPFQSHHYSAAANLASRWNDPGQFAQPPYRPGIHRGRHLLCRGPGVESLSPVWPETARHPEPSCLF